MVAERSFRSGYHPPHSSQPRPMFGRAQGTPPRPSEALTGSLQEELAAAEEAGDVEDEECTARKGPAGNPSKTRVWSPARETVGLGFGIASGSGVLSDPSSPGSEGDGKSPVERREYLKLKMQVRKF